MVVPREHRATVFDLTEQEWRSTRVLLREMRDLVAAAHQPDGWNVGWNVQPVGGSRSGTRTVTSYRAIGTSRSPVGIRTWIKDPDNRPPAHPPLPRPAWRG